MEIKANTSLIKTHIIYIVSIIGIFFLIGYPFVYWTIRLEEVKTDNTFLKSHYTYLKNLYFEVSMFWGIFWGYLITIAYLDYMFFSSFVFKTFGIFMFLGCMFLAWVVFIPKIMKGLKFLNKKLPITKEQVCLYQ